MKTTVVSRIELPALGDGERARTGANALGERLDLVEHVSVKLDIVVGQTSLPIDKLFALSSGDLLPLNTPVDAPIDVVLNGKVIARGELVAVGDKFGINVTEISSK